MEKNSNKITKEILFRLSQDDETAFRCYLLEL